MKKARFKFIFEKSLAACMSAIEVYNKPSFFFREEVFAVLMCTAWELLLKAKILKENKNDLMSIVAKDYRTKKDGTKTQRKYPKVNRAGNVLTVGLTRALDLVRSKGHGIDENCHESIKLLIEIRDNAVHFMNKSASFAKIVQEVGTANVRNYMVIAQEWFKADFTQFNFYLMPLSFYGTDALVESTIGQRRGNVQLQNLEKFIRNVVAMNPPSETDRFSVALAVNIKFVKSTDAQVIRVKATHDEDAAPVVLREDDFLARYPLDFRDLVSKLKSKIPGFKQGNTFYDVKRELEANGRLCMVRLLDPKNPRSSKKKYYSTGIIEVFEERLRKH